jgi:hypothetical protein
MSHPFPKCYGKPDGKPRCARCRWRESCRVYAGAEPGAGDTHIIEYRDDIAAPLAEAAQTAQEGPERGTPDMDLSGVLHRLALAVVDAADGNPLRIGIVFARLAGLSLREIGDRCLLSKQGIHKHLRAVSRKNKAIGALLLLRLTASAGAELIKVDATLATYNNTLRRMKWTRASNKR